MSERRLRIHDILDLAAEGLTDEAIGDRLGMAPGTVSSHWKTHFLRSGEVNRTHAVALHIKREYAQEKKDQIVLIEKLEAQCEALSLRFAQLIESCEAKIRDKAKCADNLERITRAEFCARSFSYMFDPALPLRCTFISKGAELFDINREEIVANETNFWSCVADADKAELYGLAEQTVHSPSTRFVHTYRLKTPSPVWVYDVHQGLYDRKGVVVAVAGVVMDIDFLVKSGAFPATVCRLPLEVEPQEEYESIRPPGMSINVFIENGEAG